MLRLPALADVRTRSRPHLHLGLHVRRPLQAPRRQGRAARVPGALLFLASSSLSLHLPPLPRPLAEAYFRRSLQNLVTYKAMTFADQITAIDSCVAYHNGPNYTVEVDLVMHADTTLRVAHDVCVLDLSPSRRRRRQPRADSTSSLSRSLAARRLCRTSSRSCRRSTARSCTSTTRRATSPSTARPSRARPDLLFLLDSRHDPPRPDTHERVPPPRTTSLVD